MRSLRISLVSGVGAFVLASLFTVAFAAGSQTASSGETQIVAKLDGREITISDLRSELARLGLSANNANAERIALDSILNRALLASAARAAKIHRRPEALRRMAIAQEQALADLYIATISQPLEPTLTEIEDFVVQNRTLFGERRIYAFSVLTMPAEAFDQNRLTPLFDKSKDFSALTTMLRKYGVKYSQAPLAQASNAFPEAVRNQLAQYDIRDNIVIKGETETQIMKIDAITQAPITASEALAAARRILMQRSAQSRAENMLASLKKKSSLSYYRVTSAPLPGNREGEGR